MSTFTTLLLHLSVTGLTLHLSLIFTVIVPPHRLPGTVQHFAETRISSQKSSKQISFSISVQDQTDWTRSSRVNFCNSRTWCPSPSFSQPWRCQNVAQQCGVRDKYVGGSLTLKLISNSIFRDMKKCLFVGQSHFWKVSDMQASVTENLFTFYQNLLRIFVKKSFNERTQSISLRLLTVFLS